MISSIPIKISVLMLMASFCYSCSEQKAASQVGYIDGQYTYIATNVPGTLHKLLVSSGQEVKKGDLLFQLDQEPESSNLEAISANIKQLEIQIDFFKKQLDRQQFLFKENATSKIQLEKAQIDYDNYVQQLAATKANYVETEWSLKQKTLYSPVDGQVFDTFYQPGEKVVAFKPVLALLDQKNIKVIFYLPEKDLHKIKIGQAIDFDCDSCQHKNTATISYISPMAEYTPPLIYNKESRENLVYLVRADLSSQEAREFRPGQPVDIYLDHE